MNRLLGWWYKLSLPERTLEATPGERERSRYARLTSGFLFFICVLFLPLSVIMIFYSPYSPSSPPIGIGALVLLACAFGFGKTGWSYLSASCIIAHIILPMMAVMVTNPLDPSLLPLFGVFTLSIILAGALLPPVASLVVGALSCLCIIFVSQFVPHTAAYEHMLAKGLFTVTLILPICIQVIVSVVIFVTTSSLINTIRRADRAEEIVMLQQELAQHVQAQIQQKQQLEEGFQKIAETHARFSNGEVNARVSLSEGHVLWNVAGSLNNLLSRMQRMKSDADMLTAMRQAAYQVSKVLHKAVMSGKLGSLHLPTTSTPLDPVIIELNNMARHAPPSSQSQSEGTSKQRV